MPDEQVVVDRLIAYLAERKALGERRYGRPLTTHNGRSARHDAFAEIVDHALYFAQDILETEGDLPRGDDEDREKTDRLREAEGLKRALRNLIVGLEGRMDSNRRLGSLGSAVQEDEIIIDALRGILANPTAALQS